MSLRVFGSREYFCCTLTKTDVGGDIFYAMGRVCNQVKNLLIVHIAILNVARNNGLLNGSGLDCLLFNRTHCGTVLLSRRCYLGVVR